LKFGETAHVYLGLGYATNKEGTHTETFTPTPTFGDYRFIFHNSVVPKLTEIDRMVANKDRHVARVDFENRIHIFMGMTEVNYV
jgi:hypothetical protein